jgi:hypothetical protein
MKRLPESGLVPLVLVAFSGEEAPVRVLKRVTT